MDWFPAARALCMGLTLAASISGCATHPFPDRAASLPAPAPAPAPAPEPVASAPVVAAPAPVPVVAAPAPSLPAPAIRSGPSFYKLWYATNRTPVIAKNEVVDYSSKWDDTHIHYGTIYAEVPGDFLSTRGNSGFFSRLFQTSESKLRLTKPKQVDAQAFSEQLMKDLGQVPVDERQVLIYLHGFNTTFKEAAQRAANIGYQLKIPTTAFFSWPSQGKLLKYEADKDLAGLSQDSIADFILKTYAESGAKRVHLIAHSMGNYALLGALYRPKMQQAIKDGLRFGQVILAAPDVDTDIFRKDAKIFSRIAERVSLYVSDGDMALRASIRVAAGRKRAGSRPPVVVVNNIDTVDVSETNLTLLGHAYISAEVAVLNDIHSLILHNDPPEKRLRILKKNDYWELR